jgi:hypothetical protein
MTTLQQQIVESFMKELDESKHVDAQQIEQLKAVFNDGKKLKVDDVIKILSPSVAGDVK